MANEEKVTQTVSEEVIEATKKAVKSQKKKTSPVTGKKIISIDGALQVKTDAQIDEDTYLDLNESVKNKKILTGMVTGVEKQGNHIVALIFMENYKVMIPAEEFIDIGDPGERDKVKYTEYLLSKRIGSEIDFIVKAIDKERGLAIASRKEAMVQKCKEMINPAKKKGQTIFYKGAVVEARVVQTIRSGIVIEAGGVETLIPSRELSYQRIQDATEAFSVGQRVIAYIEDIEETDVDTMTEERPMIPGTEIKRTEKIKDAEGNTQKVEKTYMISLKASLKKAQKNPYEVAMKRYQVHQMYLGKVSMVDENGVFVALNGNVDVLCPYPQRGERPTRGTKVSVRITLKNEEMNRIFGIICAVIK